MEVDQVAIVTLTCCVLQKIYKIHFEWVPLPTDVEHHRDPYVGLSIGILRLPNYGQVGKVPYEKMRAALFHSWVLKNLALWWVLYYFGHTIILW